MVDAIDAADVPNMVWYNYRPHVPAVPLLLKQLLDEVVSVVFSTTVLSFLQDWTISSDLPQGGEGHGDSTPPVAGSGVTGDLLAHNIDMAMWLNEPIGEVSGMTETLMRAQTQPHR